MLWFKSARVYSKRISQKQTLDRKEKMKHEHLYLIYISNLLYRKAFRAEVLFKMGTAIRPTNVIFIWYYWLVYAFVSSVKCLAS